MNIVYCSSMLLKKKKTIILAVLGEYESNFRWMKCERIRPRHEVDSAAGPVELRPNSPERSCRVRQTEHSVVWRLKFATWWIVCCSGWGI